MGKQYNKHGGLISFRKTKANELINIANRMTDLQSQLNISLETPDYLGVIDGVITVECVQASKVNETVIDELMKLLQQNMQDLYTSSSWGWNAETKRAEAFSSKSWLIICHCKNASVSPDSHSLVGFVSFRFEREDEYPFYTAMKFNYILNSGIYTLEAF
ncbi:unnamed protein product [Heterobilharzia americana]|nr:unnamed protein product [Heterobilharzia americana]